MNNLIRMAGIWSVIGGLVAGCVQSDKAKPAVVEQNGWFDFNKNGVKDPYEDPSRPLDARVADLLGRMNEAEKIAQLAQSYTDEFQTNVVDLAAAGRIGSLCFVHENPKFRNDIQRAAVERTRLGIPLLFGRGVVHGIHFHAPIAPAMAGAFEPALLEQASAIAARIARADGLDLVFAPMCDTARDPRWGRVSETCGEDPYLNALCVAAQVHGFQGRDPAAPDRVGACLKHFVGYSAVTGGRDYNETEVSDWTLRNLHLVPFRAGVRAGALAVMSSFNPIDGIPAVANHRMLTDILRGEWSFGGFVVSDWNTVGESITWGFAKDATDAAARALAAGNDIDMCSGLYEKGLPAALKDGRVPRAVLDEAVRRVLAAKFRLGLFDRPYVDEARLAEVLKDVAAKDAPFLRACVARTCVLLKNDGVLPLATGLKHIAVVGPLAEDVKEPNGSWTSFPAPCSASLAQALKEALPEAEVVARTGCALDKGPDTEVRGDGTVVAHAAAGARDDQVLQEEAVAAARAADVVVMALGEPAGMTGENASRHTLGLTGHQQELFDAVAAAGKPVVVVVFSGRPLALPTIWAKAAAVLYAWQPGYEAGHGIADLIVGRASPSARLVMSVPHDVSMVPCYYNCPITGRPDQGFYRELGKGGRGTAFAFGYGLTYTTFAYQPVRIIPAKDGAPAEAETTVTNTGTRPGTEVVQLYVHQKACAEGCRPGRELRGFERVTLAPGEKKVVSFPLTDTVLGYVDRAGKDRCDAGDYQIWIAPDAGSGTAADFTAR